jgi:hypothetical protein
METEAHLALLVAGSALACTLTHYIFTPICASLGAKDAEGAPGAELAQTVVSIPACSIVAGLYAYVVLTSVRPRGMQGSHSRYVHTVLACRYSCYRVG